MMNIKGETCLTHCWVSSVATHFSVNRSYFRHIKVRAELKVLKVSVKSHDFFQWCSEEIKVLINVFWTKSISQLMKDLRGGIYQNSYFFLMWTYVIVYRVGNCDQYSKKWPRRDSDSDLSQINFVLTCVTVYNCLVLNWWIMRWKIGRAKIWRCNISNWLCLHVEIMMSVHF